MKEIVLTIDSKEVKCEEGEVLLKAAQKAGIYIPALCSYPTLALSYQIKPDEFIYRGTHKIEGGGLNEEFEGCGFCVVEIEKEGLQLACHTPAQEKMVVQTNTEQVQTRRQERLAAILLQHPHGCLICDQGEGCIPFQANCPRDVPPKERCCTKYGNCEFEKIVKYLGIKKGVGRPIYQDIPILSDNPFFEQNYNLCINCLRCVRICKDFVRVGALGFIYTGEKIVVGTVGPSLQESGCKFCGCCVAVCPTGALTDKGDLSVGREKILLPCQTNCPLKIDVPRYIQYISQGEFEKALDVIYEKTPFPATLGRVCPHPCEDNCRRGQLDEPIAICDLKRFVADRVERNLPTKGKERPERVAIIGSGPAGLSGAYYLSLKGYQVTIFEKLPTLGGMLRKGIPAYRLPPDILDREIESIQELGVEIRTNTPVGNGISIENLFSQGFKAIFIGSGASKDLRMNIPGEDSPGVIPGLIFLGRINSGQGVQVGERAAIIGGGNVAIDAARSALRIGSKKVTILYRRSRKEMPANDEEIEESLSEGIKIQYLVAPTKINPKREKGMELHCLRTQLGKPDSTGRESPIPIENSEFVIEFDTVIVAIGQAPTLSFISHDIGIELTAQGSVKVDPITLQTSRNGIFAGGDVVTGPKDVVNAIEMGRRAAASIDQYLGGTGMIEQMFFKDVQPPPWLGREEDFLEKLPRRPIMMPAEERIKNFNEVRLCFEERGAVDESSRCLRCHFRFQIPTNMLPPEKWLIFDEENVKNVPDIEGVYQLLNSEKNIIYIMGTENIRRELENFLDFDHLLMEKVRYFIYEETSLFTTRQNEMLQTHLQAHGSFPEGNEEF